MSLGTRCHQLAMYVVYESPLQMLADSPTNYLREPEAMEFLSAVPTVWDETRVLDGAHRRLRRGRAPQGPRLVRRRDDRLDAARDRRRLSFLAEGPGVAWTMVAFADGADADKVASRYVRSSRAVTRTTRLKIKLAPGGGWAARISAAKNAPGQREPQPPAKPL